MKNVNDTNPMCFGCGKNNPIGLHMHFKVDENGCSSHFTPEPVIKAMTGGCTADSFPPCLMKPWGIIYLYEHRVPIRPDWKSVSARPSSLVKPLRL